MTLITKADCQKCQYIKEKINKKRNDVVEFDVTNANLPILIDGDKIVSGAINISNYLKLDEVK